MAASLVSRLWEQNGCGRAEGKRAELQLELGEVL